MKILILCLLIFSQLIQAEVVTADQLSKINLARNELSKTNLQFLNVNKDHIIGIEFLLAQDGGGFFEKNYLPLIRFIDNDINPGNDIVISFLPERDMNHPYVEHRSIMVVDNLKDYLPTFQNKSSYNLNRYIIPTNVQIRNELISNLNLWFTNANLRGEFSLLYNNSSILLFNFLNTIEAFTRYKATRLSTGRRPRYNDIVKVSAGLKPTYLADSLKTYGIASYPKLKIESLTVDTIKLEKVLSTNEVGLQSGEGWPANAVDLIEYDFSDLAIKRILQTYQNMPVQIRDELSRKHSFKIGAKLDEVLGFKMAPVELYQLCDSSICAQNIHQLGNSVWGPVVWEHQVKLMNTALYNLKLINDFARINGRMENSSVKAQIFINHYLFLLK